MVKDRETKVLLLEVAEKHFSECGYSAVSLKDIASEIGIAKSTLFHHFSSKQDLYLAVVEQIFQDLKELLRDKNMFSESYNRESFNHFFRNFLQWLDENSNRTKIIIRLQLENSEHSKKLSKRFWVPMLKYLDAIRIQLNPSRSKDARVAILGVLNSMIHFVFSLDSHLFLFQDKSREDLLLAYENHVLLNVQHILL
ncbi:MAG: TetR/AcrR family transcriptional regulator [Spirochaetota bacterium]